MHCSRAYGNGHSVHASMHIAIKTDTLFIKNYLIAYKKETRKKQFTFTVTANTPVIDINSVFSDLFSLRNTYYIIIPRKASSSSGYKQADDDNDTVPM